MADFCKQCSEEIFGEDLHDFDQMSFEVENMECTVLVLCEGCGATMVNSKGECQGGCLKAKAHARKDG